MPICHRIVQGLAGLLGAVACTVLAVPAASAFELDTPEGQLRAFRRIQCSEVDGEAVTYSWRGAAYSRVQGERDRKLFNVEGMNIRQCVTVNDPEKGAGFRFVTREILLYLDPETNEILRTWKNPWTGVTTQVLHVANDPVNQGPIFPRYGGGRTFSMPFQFNGDHWWLTSTVPLYYGNKLGGDYQDYIGGKYHATEMFNFFGDVASLTDERSSTADNAVGWARISDWLPWMEMGSREGVIYMHTAGRKLGSFDELPAIMKEEIARNYPEYTQPPPLDDDRPNETSWTYFKKMVESGKFTGSAGLKENAPAE
ncbi:MAG: DUF1838 family protein [Gammaproteobacteria bacterium]|jgi:hypothetical protein|nr:DUF1838 family protein [Gammaproteobacteria bacterium]